MLFIGDVGANEAVRSYVVGVGWELAAWCYEDCPMAGGCWKRGY